MRQLAAQAAAEIAVIRYLSNADIPHEVVAGSATRWPASALRLGGRPVFVHAHLTRRNQRPPALNRDLMADGQAAEGVHLFALADGQVTKGPRELAPEVSHFLLHPLPRAWARPATWRPLGALAFKLEEGPALNIELGGLSSEHKPLQLGLDLKAGERVVQEGDFYALHYLRAGRQPTGRLGVSSPSTGLQHIIKAGQWGNLFVYGERIELLGYLSGRELLGRRAAKRWIHCAPWRICLSGPRPGLRSQGFSQLNRTD